MRRMVMIITTAAVVLWAAVYVDVCWCWVGIKNKDHTIGNAKERVNFMAGNAKVKAEDMKQSAAEAMQDAKETAHSWNGLAYEKFSEGLGLNGYTRKSAQDLMDRAGDAASKIIGSVNSAALESSRFVSEKAGEKANRVYEEGDNIKDFASDKADQLIRMATDTANEASETMGGKDKAANTYDKVDEVRNFASEMAEPEMQTAGDKAADATESLAGATKYGKDRAAGGYSNMGSDMMKRGMNNGRNAAADAYEIASDWAGEAKVAMEEGMKYARSRASNAFYDAKERVNLAKDIASDKVGNAKESTEDAMQLGKERATQIYDEAKKKMSMEKETGAIGDEKGDEMHAFDDALNKVGEAYKTAKGMMTDHAKDRYGAAKERLSKATGDVGAKMRADTSEL